MHLHLLGICGTFMAGLAHLARETGHTVSGSDSNIYPPMSDFLAAAGIDVQLGWDPAQLKPRPDLVIIGNALSRGNPLVEATLDGRLPYTSGPAWLAENILHQRHVLAVAGTHGKTTTSSLLAWILEATGHAPGFLIGGIPENFGQPARLGTSGYFVIEADEYDTAFFDKRSKFVHYRPTTLVLNNLEFDHADIFPDLAAIQHQFHHLVRTVPARGIVLWNRDETALAETLKLGLWSRSESFGEEPDADWRLRREVSDGRVGYTVTAPGESAACVLESPLAGRHNALNIVAATAAAAAIGIPAREALAAVRSFDSVKRRLQVLGTARGVTVYDDFAHHPTAIAATIGALRERIGNARIVAVLEPRSNTMRMGVLRQQLAPALGAADLSVLFAPANLGWDIREVTSALGDRALACTTQDQLLNTLLEVATPGSHVLVMSNGDFGDIHRRVLQGLSISRAANTANS